MRRILALIVLTAVSSFGSQTGASAPQTARQALLEMFFSKTPGTFVKHLPAATRSALEKAGALATLEQYSVLASQMQTQGKNVETFETGSVLLAMQDPRTGQKLEITVENDALSGNQDDIELSFLTYKDGQAQKTPFMPRITFAMKTEAGLWKLNEIAVTIRLPLADPDFLNSIGEAMKARASGSVQTATGGATISQTPADDSAVLGAIRTILTAEMAYAATYPNTGFTCTLSDLDGFGGGEANERHAMLIPSGLASGRKYGYVFALSQCGQNPAGTFHLTAVPNGGYGRRTFCTDQSGVVRSSPDGNAATCFTSGTPVK